MNQRNKLRNTLQGYYDEQEFPVHPDGWEQASKHIKASKNNRRLRFFGFLLSVFLLAVFTLLFQLTGNNQTASADEAASSRNGKKEFQAQTHATSSDDKIDTRQSAQPDQTGRSQKKAPANKIIKPHPEQKPSEEFMPAMAFPVAEPDKNRGNMAADVTGIKQADELGTPVSGDLKNKNADVDKENPPQQILNAGVATAEHKNHSRDQPVDPAIDYSKTVDELLPRPAAFCALPVPDRENHINISLQKSDSSTAESSNRSATDTTRLAAIPTQREEGIFYEAGAAGFFGWKVGDQREANGFSPVFGISYLNKLNKNYDLTFGLHYYQVGNLTVSSKTSRVSSYTYGEHSQVTVITPTKLHYLAIPFRLQRHLGIKNTFGLGLNMGYLLNVDATVQTYDESPGSTSNHQTEKLSGYTRGFLWFDSQLSVFYQRSLSSSFSLHSELFFGLTDVKDNVFFGHPGVQRNSGFKLTLMYYAFRKK